MASAELGLDPARAGVGAVLLRSWAVGGLERQRAALAALRSAWERPWPGDTPPLACAALASVDGTGLLQYAQIDADRPESVGELTASRWHGDRELGAALPGSEPGPVAQLRPYRCAGTGGPVPSRPHVVAVSLTLAAASESSQREWADSVIAALASDPRPALGLRRAHFHLGADGTTILNLAEWDDEQSFRAWAGRPEPVEELTPEWRRVHDFAGVAGHRLAAYRWALAVGRPSAPRT